MEFSTILPIALLVILWVPLIIVLINSKFLKTMFEVAKAYGRKLGFLSSVNGVIRVGKTSFVSGLIHILQFQIEEMLMEKMDTVRKIYKRLDFNELDELIDETFQDFHLANPTSLHDQKLFDDLLENVIHTWYQRHYDLDTTIINDFLGNKTSRQYFEDYIFAYWVFHYRKNYVQSKTIFYSHVTGNMSVEYDIFQNNINESYDLKNYAIYDYMVEVIDEASDEVGANKRFDDVKEEGGDKDYRRKFGQIHQERNWQIVIKQDVKDEKKKLRSLTQSNIWIPEKVEQRGTYRIVLKVFTFLFKFLYFFYIQTYTKVLFIINLFRNIPILKKTFINYLKFLLIISFFTLVLRLPYYVLCLSFFYNDEFFNYFKEKHYKSINLRRTLDNYLLHLDWYLKSIGYNKYLIRVYSSEDDVRKNDPNTFVKQVYYIPTIYCWGTYDTHKYRNIQHELLLITKTQSKESNWFDNRPYFKESEKTENESKEISF